MQGIEPKGRTKVTLVPWTHLQQEESDTQLLYDTKARIAVLTDLARQQLIAYGEEDFLAVLRQPKMGATRRSALSKNFEVKATGFHFDEVSFLHATSDRHAGL